MKLHCLDKNKIEVQKSFSLEVESQHLFYPTNFFHHLKDHVDLQKKN